jgi:hypothetical protein
VINSLSPEPFRFVAKTRSAGKKNSIEGDMGLCRKSIQPGGERRKLHRTKYVGGNGDNAHASTSEKQSTLPTCAVVLIMSVFDLSHIYDKHVVVRGQWLSVFLYTCLTRTMQVTGASAGIGAATVRYWPPVCVLEDFQTDRSFN